MVWKRVVAAVLASADKHSASVQPHSSTLGGADEEEEKEDLNIEPRSLLSCPRD